MECSWPLFLCSFLLLVLGTAANQCIDMEAHREEVTQCCRHEAFSTEEVFEKCYRELSRQLAPDTPDFTVCFLDCTYREMGYLNEANEIQLPKYIEFLTAFENTYQVAVANALNACNAIKADIRRDVQNLATKCDAFALLFHVCVTQLTMENCPADRWTASDICAQVKMNVPPCQ